MACSRQGFEFGLDFRKNVSFLNWTTKLKLKTGNTFLRNLMISCFRNSDRSYKRNSHCDIADHREPWEIELRSNTPNGDKFLQSLSSCQQSKVRIPWERSLKFLDKKEYLLKRYLMNDVFLARAQLMGADVQRAFSMSEIPNDYHKK